MFKSILGIAAMTLTLFATPAMAQTANFDETCCERDGQKN